MFFVLWNTFYCSAHFIVTFIAYWLTFALLPQSKFSELRWTIALCTALAIVGFSTFPLMPPRLLDKTCENFGAHELQVVLKIPRFGFVDTLELFGGLWSFSTGGMKKISNQYAAMPSLHLGWSVWCVFCFRELLPRKVVPFLNLYPVATLFSIVVTANHYWLDGLAGVVLLFISMLLVKGLTVLLTTSKPIKKSESLQIVIQG